MIRNWFNIFLFHLKQNKLFTFLNILGLSLGVSCLIFSLLYWNSENAYNQWNPEKENVFQVLVNIGNDEVWANNPATVGPLLKKSSQLIDSYCYFDTYYFSDIVEYKGKKEQIEKAFSAQKNFFEYFPFPGIKGSLKAYKNDPFGVAISEEVAYRLFGKEDPIGKTFLFNDFNLNVCYVFDNTKKASINPDMIVNTIDTKIQNNQGDNEWGNFNFGFMVKLKDPSKKEKLEREIENLFIEHKTKKEAEHSGLTLNEFIKKYGSNKVFLEQLKTERLNDQKVGYPEGKGSKQVLISMLALSALILLLSIVNHINLATANAIQRAKEVGIRKVLGANKKNIIFQFLFETSLISFLTLLFTLSLSELLLPYYNDLLHEDFILNNLLLYQQLAILFLILILFAGLFPAIYVANFEKIKVLKGNFSRSKRGIWIRNSMLVLQFSIAAFFIVCAFVVNKQVDYMSNKDLGFNGNQSIEINFRTEKYENVYDSYSTIKHEIEKIPGVKKVSSGTFTLGSGSNSSSSFIHKDNIIQGQNMAIDFGMLEMLDIKLKEGRYLDEKFASDTTESVLINEVALKRMEETNPIGKFIEWNGNRLKIIGIVKDFNLRSLEEDIPPMVFFHYKTIDWMRGNLNRITVKLESQNLSQTLTKLEAFWIKNVNEKYPFEYNFVDKQFALTYQKYIEQRNVLSILNCIVILIALFGLFALASFNIQRRMKEIAIRKTLGADTKRLLYNLSKQYILLGVVGFLISIVPSFYLLNSWLQDFTYRIEISFFPFLFSFVILMTLMLVVVLGRAYKATKVDVLKYLKYE
jgi:putative ABC transport system permease protein